MQPNILFIVIDSVNANKFYGQSKHSVTPNIDKLMKNGQYFSQAISSADGTILSWASMLTGLHPFKTGIRSEKLNKVNSNVQNCFQIFKDNGYHFFSQAPFVSTTVGLFPPTENPNSTFDLYLSLHEGLGDKIVNMFEKPLPEPWITYLHFEDLHFPVKVHKDFESESFGPTNFDKSMSGVDVWIGKILEKIDLNNTLVVLTADHGSYVKAIERDNKVISFEVNAELQKQAHELGKKIPKFLQPLKSKTFFLLENARKKMKEEKVKNFDLEPHEKRALLWQRSDKDHFLFDDQVHVPLLLSGYTIPKNKIIEQQVRLMDIFPTLCELANIPFEISHLDGKSLVNLLHENLLEEYPAYIESSHLSMELVTNDVIGIRTSQYKYFRDKDNREGRIHLFDLKNDPYENENIALKQPDIVKSLEKQLGEILSDKTSQYEPEIDDDETEKIEKELRKLGYM